MGEVRAHIPAPPEAVSLTTGISTGTAALVAGRPTPAQLPEDCPSGLLPGRTLEGARTRTTGDHPQMRPCRGCAPIGPFRACLRVTDRGHRAGSRLERCWTMGRRRKVLDLRRELLLFTVADGPPVPGLEPRSSWSPAPAKRNITLRDPGRKPPASNRVRSPSCRRIRAPAPQPFTTGYPAIACSARNILLRLPR